MQAWISSFLFCKALQAKKENRSTSLIHLPVIDSDILLTRYEPIKNRKNHPVILLHGLTRLGRDDPRIVELKDALVSIGYSVYLPNFPEIANHEMNNRIFDRLRTTFKTIIEIHEQGNPVSIFAASYLGSAALQVCIDESLKTSIKSICTIGSCYEFPDLLKEGMNCPIPDPYFVALLVKNILIQKNEYSAPLAKAFDLIFENLNQDKPLNTSELPFTGLNSYEIKLARNGTNREFLKKLFEKDSGNTFEPPCFNLKNTLPQIKAKVTLIHGEKDPIIFSHHAKRIAELLPKKQSHMLITPLLSHGDHSLRISRLLEVFRCLKAFYFFFKYAEPEKNQQNKILKNPISMKFT